MGRFGWGRKFRNSKTTFCFHVITEKSHSALFSGENIKTAVFRTGRKLHFWHWHAFSGLLPENPRKFLQILTMRRVKETKRGGEQRGNASCEDYRSLWHEYRRLHGDLDRHARIVACRAEILAGRLARLVIGRKLGRAGPQKRDETAFLSIGCWEAS